MARPLSRARTMQAAILVAQNRPLVVDEVLLPDSLNVGQVLVQIHYSGICGAQLGEIDGVKGDDPHLPHLLGHEGSGEVLEVGPGVRHVKQGDRVVLHWRKGKGIESDTPAYQWRGRRLNAGWVTTFNEYAVVSENRLTPIPASLNLVLAPLFGCAVTTGLGVITNNAQVRIGESVVVFGVGGVGLNVVQGAALVSAQPIIAVDLHGAKLELARTLGATHIVNAQAQDPGAEIRRILGNPGADVVVECTGRAEVIELAYELAGAHGRVVCVGVPKRGQNISIHSLPLHFGKVLAGSHGGESDPGEDIPRYARLHEAGKLRLRELITGRFALSEINTAIEKMRAGEIAGRCLIEVVRGG